MAKPTRDHESAQSQLGEVEPLPDAIKSQARRTVASYSDTPQECAEFFFMLGIHPSQEIEFSPTSTRVNSVNANMAKATHSRRSYDF